MTRRPSFFSEIHSFRRYSSLVSPQSLAPSELSTPSTLPLPTTTFSCLTRKSPPPRLFVGITQPRIQYLNFFPIATEVSLVPIRFASQRILHDQQKLGSSGHLLTLVPALYRGYKATHIEIFLPNHGSLRQVDKTPCLPIESVRNQIRMQFQKSSSCRRFSSSASQQFSGIAESVLSRCFRMWEKKKKVQSVEKDSLGAVLELFCFLPDLIRGFRRVKALKSDDVLKILVSCLEECRVREFEERILDSAWQLFTWAPNQKQFGYYQLPRSYNVMLSMLIGGGMIEKAESLLLRMDTEGIVVDTDNLILLVQEYIEIGDIESSLSMHERAKKRGCSLNSSCYTSLIDCLIRANRTQLALTLLMDLLEVAPNIEIQNFGYVITALCEERRIQDAKAILRKMVDLGFEPDRSVLDKISYGYCDKYDFEGLLNFFNEYRYVPIDNCLCNKIIYSQCQVSGSERALSLMQELANLGFLPDRKSFGILICWSCREGRLRNAMMLFSELILRGLEPDVYIYNSIISGLFKLGLGRHSKEVLLDMIERGVKPDMSTCRVLLAGYCKERRFDDAKWVVHEVASLGLGLSSSSIDGLMAAFSALGLDYKSVKVKRDNTVGLLKAEFFDALGNGFYLETDVHTYERTLSAILDAAVRPHFDVAILKECSEGDMEAALKLENEMVQWGEEPSVASYSAILKGLCGHCCTKASIGRLLEMPKKYLWQLDHETLDLVVKTLGKENKTSEAMLILEHMLCRNLPIDSGTYTAVLIGLCKEKNRKEFQKCWGLALQDGWVPCFAHCRTVLDCLCELNMLKEALQLLENMLMNYSESSSFIFGLFFEELCCHNGLAGVTFMLAQEMLERGLSIDHALSSYLITGLCKEKLILEAMWLFDVMLAKAQNPVIDVYKFVVPELCRSGQLEKAISLGYTLLDKQLLPATSIHGALINELCKMGKVSDAMILFQEMMSKGLCPVNAAFDAIMKAKCLEKSLRDVYEILCAMLKRSVIPSIKSYRNILKLLCLEGKVFDAVNMKDFFLRERKYPAILLYTLLIYQLFQVSNIPMVMNLLSEMHGKGLIMDSVAYNVLTVGFSRSGNVSISLKFLEIMMKKNLRPSNRSFRTVITSLCSLGQLNKALELSYRMECRNWAHCSLVQHTLVHALLAAGRISEAELFLDRMEKKGLVPDNIVYDGLIRQFCKFQRLDRAVGLLNTMLKRSNLPTDATYRTLIPRLCHHSSLDQAFNLYVEMLHKGLEPSACVSGAIIYALCDCGRAEEAEEALSGMLQRGQTPSITMYQSVIDSYSKLSKLKKASEVLKNMQQHGYRPDFRIHWSLISNLASKDDEDNHKKSFLSQILLQSGFSLKENTG